MFKKLIPTLLIYFGTGLSGFTFLTSIYLKKNYFQFTSQEWTAIALFGSMPWSIKILFSAIVDAFKVYGLNRSVFIFIAAFLLCIGNFMFLDMLIYLPRINYIAAMSVILSSGIVLADVVADTMAVEAVKDLDKSDLARSALYSRVSQLLGGLAGTGLAFIAQHILDPFTTYLVWFIIPLTFLTSGFYCEDYRKLRSK